MVELGIVVSLVAEIPDHVRVAVVLIEHLGNVVNVIPPRALEARGRESHRYASQNTDSVLCVSLLCLRRRRKRRRGRTDDLIRDVGEVEVKLAVVVSDPIATHSLSNL